MIAGGRKEVALDKTELRDGLMHDLWRMNKMNLMVSLREFVEGETAALWFLHSCGAERVSPSQISENLHVSRARAANILRSLRNKGYVEMEISPEDRRKMDVFFTPKGKRFLEEKYDFLLRYFDLFVDVLGEADILELTRLLKRVADNNLLLKSDGENDPDEEVGQ